MNNLWFKFSGVLIIFFIININAVELEMTFDQKGQIQITQHGAPLVTGSYVGWAHNWKWAETKIINRFKGPGKYGFEGSVSRLNLKMYGVAVSFSDHSLTIIYEIAASQKWDDIKGFGIEWHLNTDSPVFPKMPKSPSPLPQAKGWEWEVNEKKKIRVTFKKSIGSVHFEGSQKKRIRTLFFKTAIPHGSHTIQMTIDLPKGGRLVKSVSERYDPKDRVKWLKNVLSLEDSPVDLSFLNHKPAGKYGFVRAENDQLIFSNGTPIRFWGGNIAAQALFSKKEHIKTHAERIAKLGYNLIRIHHHDSMGWVKPAVIDTSRSDSQHLNSVALDHLDYWIKCLKDQGVYIWLDLHVGRQLKAGDVLTKYGQIKGFDEIKRKNSEVKGFCYFNKPVQHLMQTFNEKYLNHLNPYTTLSYLNDPAIIALLITNENDITHHFGNLMLGNKGNPYHHTQFKRALDAFCQKTNLNFSQTAKTWLPGPGKIFLNEIAYQFNTAMLTHLKKMKVNALIATTSSWGDNPIFSLPSLTNGDIIDVHAYGKEEALSQNPRYQPNFISFIAMSRVSGIPLSISEWNVPAPTPDRFTSPLYIASISALQGWNAPMIYNYSQTGDFTTHKIHTWSTFSDPSITGLMPAAALSFRKGHIQPAIKKFSLKLDREMTYFKGVSEKNSATIRTMVETSKLSIGLPDIKEMDWDRAYSPTKDTAIITTLGKDVIPKGQFFIESDTKELKRDWRKGIQTIDTPNTQAASGWIGDETLTLSDTTITSKTTKATIAIQSLDNRSIKTSKRIFISALARAENGVRMSERAVWSEPVGANIKINSNHPMKLFVLKGNGRQGKQIPLKKMDTGYQFEISAGDLSHWYLLRYTKSE